MTEDERWTDWDSGPVARAYTVTGGRTRPRVELRFDLIDMIGWTGKQVDPASVSHESRRILELCQRPITVADLASALGLPLGIVRVLLGDLVHDGLVDVRVPAPQGRGPDQRLLARVLAGIRALLEIPARTACGSRGRFSRPIAEPAFPRARALTRMACAPVAAHAMCLSAQRASALAGGRCQRVDP